MKPRPGDRMRDPFYAQLMFIVEQMICAADQQAKEQGVILKDSQVQSALIKAMALASGKAPKIEETTDAERILKDLIMDIGRAPKSLMEEMVDAEGSERKEPVRVVDWVLAVEAVVDSLKTRKSGIPGSRGYLDFVQDFIAKAKKRHM